MEFTGIFPPGINLNDYICKSSKVNSVTKDNFSEDLFVSMIFVLYNTKDKSTTTLDTFFEITPTDVEFILEKTSVNNVCEKVENFIKFKIVSDVIYIPHTEKEQL